MQVNARTVFGACSILLLAAFLFWRVTLQSPEEGIERLIPQTSNLSAVSASADEVVVKPQPKPKVLWSAINTKEELDIPSYRVEVVNAVQMQFDVADLSKLDVGDVIEIKIPQTGTRYTATVRSTKSHRGGIKTITARQSDNDSSFTLLITLGKRNTFAHVSTREGSFELVGNTQQGWLMPSANMDRHVDHTKPDYVLPPKSKAKEVEAR